MITDASLSPLSPAGAGIAGAGLWWLLKGWGVKRALGTSSVLPAAMVVILFAILKPGDHIEKRSEAAAAFETQEDDDSPKLASGTPVKFALDASEKWRLARPLIFRFMFPLFFVYVFEYSINQVSAC